MMNVGEYERSFDRAFIGANFNYGTDNLTPNNKRSAPIFPPLLALD